MKKKHYQVLEKDAGRKVTKCKVTSFKGENEGFRFFYKSESGESMVVVPKDYEYLEFQKKFTICKRKGNESACYFMSESIDNNIPGDYLFDLVKTDVQGRGYKTLHGGISAKWIILALGLVFLVGAIWVGSKMFYPGKEEVPIEEQQQEQMLEELGETDQELVIEEVD